MSPNPKKKSKSLNLLQKKKTKITKQISPNGTKSIPFEGENKISTH
jgi:hypothetical protein